MKKVNLNHLTESELNELIDEIYSDMKMKDIMEKYDLAIPYNQLYTMLPPEVFSEEVCEHCGQSLVRKRVSRGNKKYLNDTDKYCPDCGHKPYVNDCSCQKCVDKLLEKKKHKQMIIQKEYKIQLPKKFFDELSFEDKVYVGMLLYTLGNEDLDELNPISSLADFNLTGNYETFKEKLVNLLSTGVIQISPNSPIDAFIFDNDAIIQFDLIKVKFILNIEDFENLKNDILYPSHYSENNIYEVVELWKKILIEDVTKYLKYQLETVKMPFKPGLKTYKVFEQLLDGYSVAQIYNLIWRAVKNTSHEYLRKTMSKTHFYNYCIFELERLGTYHIEHSSKISCFNRPYDLKESNLSYFFFYHVLKIGDKGFTQKLNNIEL